MSESRKEAIRAYKERKVERGIYAIRCKATGSVWVESAMDLSTSQNRVSSVLKHGDPQMDKSLTAEAREHGPDAFGYEVLEKLDEDVVEMGIRDLLREKKRHWIAELHAHPVWPV